MTDPAAMTALMVIAIVLSLIIILFNVLTLIVIYETPSLHTLSNMYIFSLAVADLMVGVWLLLFSGFFVPAVHKHILMKYGSTCILMCTFGMGSAVVSILHLMFISIDRCVYITMPFFHESHATKRFTCAIIASIWAFGLVYTVLPVLVLPKGPIERCKLTKVIPMWYVVALNNFVYFLSAFVAGVMYFKILRTAARQRLGISQTNISKSIRGSIPTIPSDHVTWEKSSDQNTESTESDSQKEEEENEDAGVQRKHTNPKPVFIEVPEPEEDEDHPAKKSFSEMIKDDYDNSQEPGSNNTNKLIRKTRFPTRFAPNPESNKDTHHPAKKSFSETINGDDGNSQEPESSNTNKLRRMSGFSTRFAPNPESIKETHHPVKKSFSEAINDDSDNSQETGSSNSNKLSRISRFSTRFVPNPGSIKNIRFLFTVYGVFMITVTPAALGNTLSFFIDLNQGVQDVFLFVGSMNSAANFIIFCALSSAFREGVKYRLKRFFKVAK